MSAATAASAYQLWLLTIRSGEYAAACTCQEIGEDRMWLRVAYGHDPIAPWETSRYALEGARTDVHKYCFTSRADLDMAVALYDDTLDTVQDSDGREHNGAYINVAADGALVDEPSMCMVCGKRFGTARPGSCARCRGPLCDRDKYAGGQRGAGTRGPWCSVRSLCSLCEYVGSTEESADESTNDEPADGGAVEGRDTLAASAEA